MVLVLEIWQHKGSRMKAGVFLGRAHVLLPERETTTEGVRMKGVVWITEGTSLVRCAVQQMRSFREKIVQHRRHRSHQFPRPCQTFATQHID